METKRIIDKLSSQFEESFKKKPMMFWIGHKGKIKSGLLECVTFCLDDSQLPTYFLKTEVGNLFPLEADEIFESKEEALQFLLKQNEEG